MKWGIAVEWEELGLPCRAWWPEGRTPRRYEFKEEADIIVVRLVALSQSRDCQGYAAVFARPLVVEEEEAS